MTRLPRLDAICADTNARTEMRAPVAVVRSVLGDLCIVGPEHPHSAQPPEPGQWRIV